MKNAANQIKEELSEARQLLSNKQKECSKLEVEVQDLKKECEDESRKCGKYNQEVRLTDINKGFFQVAHFYTYTVHFDELNNLTLLVRIILGLVLHHIGTKIGFKITLVELN